MSNPFEDSTENEKSLFLEEPFNPEHFIEKLARSNAGSVILGQDGSNFDPKPLREKLKQKLSELETNFENKTNQVKRIEDQNVKKQAEFKRKAKDHDHFFAVADSHYQKLDKVINFVSTKVVHLGDQLKQLDGKRRRAWEAKELIEYMNEARDSGKISSDIFTDPAKVHEAAKIIHKISLAAHDLPESGPKDFTRLHNTLRFITEDIQNRLITDFKLSLQYYDEDVHRRNMKSCALTLTLPCFNAHSEIVEHFIQIRLKAPFHGRSFFDSIKDCIEETSEIVSDIFSDQDNVMPKFIKTMLKMKVKKKVTLSLKPEDIKTSELRTSSDLEQLLESLKDLYSQTIKLSTDLSKYDSDFSFVKEVKENIFQPYLMAYPKLEIEYLYKSSTTILDRFYESINHDKKLNPDTFQTHLKDLRTKIKNLSDNISTSNVGLVHSQSEQLLNVNVTTTLIKIHEQAVKRCLLLTEQTKRTDAFKTTSEVLRDIGKSLLNQFLVKHLEYAIDHFTFSRSILESRAEPMVKPFLMTLGNANITYHNLDKFYNEQILPNITDSQIQGDLRRLKQAEMSRIEDKISNEINHVITSIINWIKGILKSQQEKDDFNSSYCSAQNATRACNVVCAFLVYNVIDVFKGPIDGENLKRVMLELGVRFHGALLDHLMQYQYSITGAMQLIQDLHTYKNIIAHFKEPIVDHLFEGMKELCQLLVVDPQKLRSIWDKGNLATIEHGFLVQFVKLRADYRRNNVQSMLPSYSAQVRQ